MSQSQDPQRYFFDFRLHPRSRDGVVASLTLYPDITVGPIEIDATRAGALVALLEDAVRVVCHAADEAPAPEANGKARS